jgi:general nucleoside transport system permease protein
MSMFLLVLIASVTAGTSLLLATLGEIISEKGGVINLGLEGMMIMGALAGFAISHYTGSPVLGFLAGGLAGGLLSCIHAVLVVTLSCNQIVSGLALAIMGSGLSSFLGQKMIGQTASGFSPIVSDLDIIAFISFVLAFVIWGFLKYTRWGLNLSSVGHNPEASDSAGLNVLRIRYIAVIFGGILAGFGGAYLSLVYTRMWVENMVAGRGWIAIALVIFSGWSPIRAILGAYLFGGILAIVMRMQAVGTNVPVYLLLMAPYVVTILALIFFTIFENLREKFGAPESLGLPYSRK